MATLHTATAPHTAHATRFAMIMAGGSGTRLWPMSRQSAPKQLLPLVEGCSLLSITGSRMQALVQPSNALVCAAEMHRQPICAALPWMPAENFLGEPAARDTLAAVALGATVAAARAGQAPATALAVLTSDHLIQPQEEFLRALDLGYRLVEADPTRMVTFTIKPTHAATGFGYVEHGRELGGFPGAFHAGKFIEKPDRERAEKLLAAGTFGWNSGMFVFGALAFMKAVEEFKPETAAGMRQIGAALGTPQERAVLERVYPHLPKISVDHGVMEPISRQPNAPICVVPMDVEWRDIGSWPSYGQTLQADAHGNRGNARVVHRGSQEVLAVSSDPSHVIATVGLKDVIIVHTKDATLVVRADLAEQVKDLAGEVPEGLR